METKATLKDLELEKWLRARWNRKIYWETKDGKKIAINDMSNEHLENAINHLIKRKEYEDIAAEYAASIECNFG